MASKVYLFTFDIESTVADPESEFRYQFYHLDGGIASFYIKKILCLPYYTTVYTYLFSVPRIGDFNIKAH